MLKKNLERLLRHDLYPHVFDMQHKHSNCEGEENKLETGMEYFFVAYLPFR